LRLPDGHPYAAAPLWLPLPMAVLLEKLRLFLARRRPIGRFVLKA